MSNESEEFICEDLYQETEKLFESIINRIDDKWQTIDKDRFGMTDSGEIEDPHDFQDFIDKFVTWSDHDNYTKCVSTFKSAGFYTGNEVNELRKYDMLSESEEEMSAHIRDVTLPNLLITYASNSDKVTSFDQDTYRQTYKRFESYLERDKITVRFIVHVGNLKLTGGELSFNSDIRIVGENPNQSDYEEPPLSLLRDFDTSSYIIADKEVDKFGVIAKDEGVKIGHDINDVLTTLRLHNIKPGFEVHGATSTILEPFAQPIHTMDDILIDGIDFFGGLPFDIDEDEPYVIESEDVEEIVKIWESMKEFRQSPEAYRVALDKFSSSFQRTDTNDAILDCVIALDALYLKQQHEGSMTNKLSQRGALLLAENRSEALEIYNKLSDAYSSRSAIVHGGTKEELGTEKLVQVMELTRDSLTSFLEISMYTKGLDFDRSQILDELDYRARTPE